MLALAVAAFVWAVTDARFMDHEGFLQGTVCLPLSIAAASVMVAVGSRAGYRSFALWLALAFVGQAAALQMVEAGSELRYQHYRTQRMLGEFHGALLVFLGAQTALVVAGIWRRLPEIREWLRANLGSWRVAVVGVVFVLTSATLSSRVADYLGELVVASFVLLVNLSNIVLAVWALPEDALGSWRASVRRLLGRRRGGGRHGMSITGWIVLGAAVWVTGIAAVLVWFSYERHPHVPDEVVYLYQARYLAEGRLALPVPPVPEGFDVDLMLLEDTRWYCPVPPGWPVVLSAGVLAGAPWLVNPVLAGLNVVLCYLVLRDVYDRRVALFAVLLLGASPWHVFMAMSYMTHTFTLTCALTSAWAVIQARNRGSWRWAWAGGLAAGIAATVRPLEGLIVAMLLGLWVLGGRGMRWRMPVAAAFGVGAILGVAPMLVYNACLTGDPARFPLGVYTDKYYGPGSNALGFGPQRGLGWGGFDPFPGHGPRDAVINADLNLFSVNTELLGWSVGSVLPTCVLVFSGAMKRGDYLMLAVVLAVVGVHTFYWFSGGPDFGARYWYLILVPLAALTVRGLQFLASRLEARGRGNGARVLAAAIALSLMAVANVFPWRAIDKYHHFRGMRPDVRDLARQCDFGRSLVLIHGDRHPDYASAAIYNPLDWHADAPVFAWDRSPEVRSRLLEAYADRPVWLIDGPAVTGSGYRVAAGPVWARDLKGRTSRAG